MLAHFSASNIYARRVSITLFLSKLLLKFAEIHKSLYTYFLISVFHYFLIVTKGEPHENHSLYQ
jgi:hypothetical protein